MLFNALQRNQKAIQCLEMKSLSHPMPWKGIRKPSNAFERNPKAIKCLKRNYKAIQRLEKESESYSMP
jgi:hypothetical protein